MIGDTDGDVLAGKAAGCQTALIAHPASAHKRSGTVRPDASVGDFAEAVALILRSPASTLTVMSGNLDVKIFADGADLDSILALASDRRIAGFTTNPTLMWKAGLTDYEEFAKRLLERITVHPISFEVFADDRAEIHRQALKIADWGENVYVRISSLYDPRGVDGPVRP